MGETRYAPSPGDHRWRATLAGLGAALALLAASCAGGEPAVTPPAVTPPAETARGPYVRIYALGQTARAEAGEVIVHGVRLSGGEGAEAPPAGFEWLFFDLGVLNTGTRPLAFHARLRHIEGADYERAYPATTISALDAPIAGGAGIRGEIAFVVAAGGAGVTLLYGIGDEVWALQVGAIQRVE